LFFHLACPLFYRTFSVEAHTTGQQGQRHSPEKEGGQLLMGWRSKFVFMLIVYFAGFATAIYCLAPAPEGMKGTAHAGTLLDSALTSDRLVRSVNTGMHKCVDMGKETAVRAAKLIQEKMEETRLQLDD
jgi:hypothetical protein